MLASHWLAPQNVLVYTCEELGAKLGHASQIEFVRQRALRRTPTVSLTLLFVYASVFVLVLSNIGADASWRPIVQWLDESVSQGCPLVFHLAISYWYFAMMTSLFTISGLKCYLGTERWRMLYAVWPIIVLLCDLCLCI